MMRAKPPFRADQVGSLLRSAPVKEARTRRLAGEITPAELKAVEDAEIAKLVAKQESIGLQAVTDGEFRRSWWHYDFLAKLDGVELVSVAQGLQFKGTQTKAEGLHVHGRIDFSPTPSDDRALQVPEVGRQGDAQDDHPLADGAALSAAAGRRSRSRSIPRWSRSSPISARPTPRRCAPSARRAAPTCSSTRCSSPISATTAQREMLRGRGDDPDKLLHVYADLVNAACAGRTPGMTISMHLCRGNFRSTWMAQGGYERVADILFNQMNVDAYFMEYDSERAGGFEPLRFLPKDKQVVLGVDDVQDRRAGKQGPAQAPDRGGREVRPARAALPVAAMRLRQDRGGQPAGRGRAVGQALALRRGRERGLGLST